MPIAQLTKPIDGFPQVQMEIRYSLGGMNNYFTHKKEKRGYYFHVNPCKQKDYGNGIYSTEIQPWHDRAFKVCIKETNRKSEKTLNKLKDILKQDIEVIKQYYEIDNTACYYKVMEVFKGV